MAASDRFIEPYFVPVDANGNTMPGATLEFFISGTSTHQNTYSDALLTTPNANPFPDDGAGRFSNIFMGQAAYKVVLKRADATIVWTADPVQAASAAIDAANLALVQAALDAAKAAAAAAIAAEGTATLAKTAAETAQAAAAASAASIDTSVIDARLTNVEADISDDEGRITVLETSFNSARITYANAAAMNADLVPAAGVIATLLDSGLQYVKVGVTTTGSWAPYPGDRYTQLENRVSTLEQDTYVADMSDATQMVVVRCKILPATSATISPQVTTTFTGTTMKCKRVAGVVTAYNTIQGGLLKRTNDIGDKAFTFTATYTHKHSSDTGVSGIGFFLSPTLTGSVVDGHVILGNAAFPAAGSVYNIIWRSNGNVVPYDGFDGALGGNIITPPGPSGLGLTFGQGDTITMIARFSGDASSVVLYFIVNGILKGHWRYTNLPTGWYIGPACRLGFSSVGEGSEIDVSVAQMDVLSADLLSYYLSPTAPGGGNGSRESRFNNVTDCATRVLQTGRKFEIIGAPGDYRTGIFQFDSRDMEKFHVYAETGGGMTMYGSTLLSAAGGNFTQPDAGTYPNMWARDWLYNGSPPHNEAGAIIELGVPSSRGGVDVIPYHLPRRYTISFAGSDAAAWALVNAHPSSHYISVTTGKIYFHASGSANPNLHDYELSNRDTCIGLQGDATDFAASYGCEFRAVGVTCKYAFASNFWFDRCRIYIQNCNGEGSGGLNGFALNDSTGQMFSCAAIGNANDGMNDTPIWGPNVTVPHQGKVELFNCIGDYNGWTELAPFTDGRHYGDGLSTHSQNNLYDWGGLWRHNGKCGSAHGMGNYRGFDVTCKGNLTSNFQIAAGEANKVQAFDVYHAISEDSPIAFDLGLVTGGDNSLATMTVRGAVVRNCEVVFSCICNPAAPAAAVLSYTDVYAKDFTTKELIVGTGVITHIPEGELITGP